MTKKERRALIERQKVEAETFSQMEQLARERGARVAQLQAQLANQTRTITNLERQNEHLRSVACRATAPKETYRVLVHVERVNEETSEFEVTEADQVVGIFKDSGAACLAVGDLINFGSRCEWRQKP